MSGELGENRNLQPPFKTICNAAQIERWLGLERTIVRENDRFRDPLSMSKCLSTKTQFSEILLASAHLHKHLKNDDKNEVSF